jgi:hypothetical protein
MTPVVPPSVTGSEERVPATPPKRKEPEKEDGSTNGDREKEETTEEFRRRLVKRMTKKNFTDKFQKGELGAQVDGIVFVLNSFVETLGHIRARDSKEQEELDLLRMGFIEELGEVISYVARQKRRESH